MEKNMYELTNPQKSIYNTEQYFNNTSINNICGSLIIKEDVNMALLNEAINYFLESNDSFQLRFAKLDGKVFQYMEKFQKSNFETLPINNESQIEIFAKKMVNKNFTLFNSRLFDFKLFKLSSGFGGFIVNIHHIISDAATFSILATEIVQNYSKLLKNEPIPQKTYSYIDYINSEKEYLKSARFQKDKSYWNTLLNPLPEAGNIPVISKNQLDKIKASREELMFDKELIQKLKAYCSKNNISIFNFLISIYSIYIGRTSQLHSFLVGTPVLNRTNFAQKHTTGMFISTSLLKIDMSQNFTFVEFLKNIASSSMQMLRHQKYNYQYIVEDLRKIDHSISNLYDILLSYQITHATDLTLDIPYSTKWYGTDYISNSLNIHFHDNDSTGNLLVEYDYQIAKYTKNDIKNIHTRILGIIQQILSNEQIKIFDIEIISPQEKDFLLSSYAKNAESFDFCNNIFQQIKINTQSKLSNIAIETENEKITYKELIQRVNKLSSYLLNNNSLPQNIGIFTNRNIDTIVGILAIINIGKTYVPIDPEYPTSRISYMLENSKINTILTTNMQNSKLIDNSLYIIDINYLNYYKSSENYTYCKDYDINANLYIVFTSGSTGNPKGITITHKNMLNLIYYEMKHTDLLNDSNRILQFATMSFDVSYQEIFSALLSASTLVLTTEEVRKNMKKLSSYIYDKKIDTLFIPPAYLRILTEDPSVLKKFYPYLKNIITAGEQLIITDGIKKLINNGIQINNHYGPAETHVATSYLLSNENTELKPPIGYAISNASVYILDKHHHLLPTNTTGEIAISGDLVGNGYINNPKLNKQKFIKDPYTSSKMYLTGDLGYIDNTNCIYYVGRADLQVKINGFRIELEEIDKILLQNPNISNSISIVKEFNNKKYIITYYSLKNNVDKNYLLSYLKENLPSYMLPFRLINVPQIGLTLNGKTDKKSLPEIDIFENSELFIEPQTDNELKLASIWKEIFNLKQIGIYDDFFKLGGDSLLSIKLCAKIEDEFNTSLNVKDIFNHSKFEDLLHFIENYEQYTNKKISPAPKAHYYPLSSSQKRIYYSTQMIEHNNIIYNLPGGIIFNGLIDSKKLEKCLNELIARHESFRTCFETIDSSIVQKIVNKVHFKLKVSTAKFEEKNKLFKNFVRPFDLAIPPLLRAELIYFDNNKSMLLFDTHHIIMDGTSLNVFIRELEKLYNGEELQKNELTYKDYAVWENEHSLINEQNNKEYWINEFEEGIPVLNIPTQKNRPITKSFAGAKIYKTINKHYTKKINEISKAYGITPYMFTLACYYILLSKYSNQDTIIVGSPIVGRPNSQLNEILGMFINTLPLKINIDANTSFNNFVDVVKNMCFNAFEHSDYPLDKIIGNLSNPRDTSRNPLFDVLFTYQNDGMYTLKLNNINSKYYLPDCKISKFDLSLEILPMDDKLFLNFEYCTDLFTYHFINNFADSYLQILKQVVQNMDIKLSDIDMLSFEEKRKILVDFNNTKLIYPKNKSLVDLFKLQVKKHPKNIAVEFKSQTITYEELDKKSDAMANMISKYNLENDEIVGVYMDKSIELIISILGILKCGLAYMPMYIKYPKSRLDYMTNNSNCKLIISKMNLTPISNSKCNILYLNNYNDLPNEKLLHTYNITPNNLAYVIYTSGSTGEPKGAKITHKCLNNYIHSFNKYYKKIDYHDRFLSSTNISFDVSIWEIFLSLLNGSVLVLYEEEIIQNIETYCNSIINNRITTLYIPPNILEEVYQLLKNKNTNISKLLVGVEPIKTSTLKKYYKLNSNMKIINGYGPTETTICATALEFHNSHKISKIVSIGKPLGNTQIYILDKYMNIVPIGVKGELYISGDGVGKGYINKPTENKSHFITNPFEKKTIMYKTGDIAKWNKNGTIDFLGREDSQIKLSGYRIELKEIDNVINSYPGIIKSITQLYQQDNQSYLVSYFTATGKINSSDLNIYLQEKLPFYMVPKVFIGLQKFPVTINGKINLKELPKPNVRAYTQYKAPESPLEKTLCKIWRDLFNLDKIGINDNFFELGGDSLSAIRLQTEALKKNLKITYADIFKYPTIKLLAKKANTSITVNIETSKNDFSKINNLLTLNQIKNISKKIQTNHIGNILLTGATGFLGAHILDAIFKAEPSSTIYCLVRNKHSQSPNNRLKNTLQFYFGDTYNNKFDSQIKVINADITKDNFGIDPDLLKNLTNNISTVINSAALVKHYGDYSDFNTINVVGTQNIINFCEKYHKKLYHISTTSISGQGLPENNQKQSCEIIYFGEKDFYKNQNLNNAYIKTKFEAEKLILNEVSNNKLNATIFRIGNIQNRYSDGKFQINVGENAFVNRIKCILKLGVLQNGFRKHSTEFAPVDLCADAIVRIIRSNPKFTVFHVFNNNLISFTDLVKYINDLGLKVDFVSNKIFSQKIRDYLKDENLKNEISGIITDLNSNKLFTLDVNILIDSDFTNKYLHQLGFNWPKIDEQYIKKYINYFKEINFFN